MLNYFSKQFGLSKTIKGIFFYNYRIVRRAFLDTSKEHILKINGHKFATIPNDKGISEELLMFKTHEPLSTKLFETFLKPGMTCLDVGSNIGYYVCLENQIIGKNGRIIAIEPSPINFKYLQKNVELQESKNIELHNFACGNREGKIDFLVSNRSNWSRVASDDLIDAPPDAIIEKISIEIKKLDLFLQEKNLEKLDFVRMDVEGYESNILKGLEDTLRIFKPSLQIEVHLFILGNESTVNLLTFFENLGYEICYYIPREMDVPILGNSKDILKSSFKEILAKLNSNTLPMNFMLFLRHSDKKIPLTKFNSKIP
jgi:FkbM family methyltransferase